jgi:hypothetical protein
MHWFISAGLIRGHLRSQLREFLLVWLGRRVSQEQFTALYFCSAKFNALTEMERL